MPIPEFVARLRERIGHDPLWLAGATAVVLRERVSRDAEVLLVRRSDTGEWAPITGIVDPGEHPAQTAVRETAEETRVTAEVERLVLLSVSPEITHVNGDRAQYCDLTFRCRWLAGEGAVGDDESSEVAWWPADALPSMREDQARRVRIALENRPECRLFVHGAELPVTPPTTSGDLDAT